MEEKKYTCSVCGKKSVVDIGTQTPNELLFSATVTEIVEEETRIYPATNQRQFLFTDWNQMGRDLRQIADDLRRTSTSDLNSSTEEHQLAIGQPESPPPSYFTLFRRHSVPDGRAYFHRPS
ncbi:uncharacterized protein LOC109601023 [Aethina tumida]|uniref:uncharacterized protein LOC109601023 n=1 Tax=Aethina tumida TaxID=116153 RepID=UPI00096B67FA|nr:uncharacterized protein LOC109601023 [Aethina tumida]